MFFWNFNSLIFIIVCYLWRWGRLEKLKIVFFGPRDRKSLIFISVAWRYVVEKVKSFLHVQQMANDACRAFHNFLYLPRIIFHICPFVLENNLFGRVFK